MEIIKKNCKQYTIYPTRGKIEIIILVVILLSAILTFTSGIPRKGALVLDNGNIKYMGILVRGKMSGAGTLTFKNGDSYTGNFLNGIFDGKGTFISNSGWTYEGQFKNGRADGRGKLTTETNIVYEGIFKQGIYQNAN